MTASGNIRLRFSVASLLVLLLTACASLSLVEDYDPQIEQSLNEYHKSFVSFVTRMEAAAGTQAGAYGGAEATAFYADSAGELANLVVRAVARNPQGQCPTSSKIAGGISGALLKSVDYFDSSGSQPQPVMALSEQVQQSLEEFNAGTSDLATGSCTVIVLKALKLNHEIFESIHKRKTYLRPPVSTIGSELISDTVQMAIIAEQSKKL